MKAKDALIAWTPVSNDRLPTKGSVRVGPLLRENDADWTSPYAYTGGAAYTYRRDMDEWQQIAMVFIEYHTLVCRDGMDPKRVHEAFLAIDEYAERISPDLPGAQGLE